MDYERANGSALGKLAAWFLNKCLCRTVQTLHVTEVQRRLDIGKSELIQEGFMGKRSLELGLEEQVSSG